MGEVRVLLIGESEQFPQLLDAMRDGVSMFNDTHGTNHALGLVTASPGIGAARYANRPHITISRIRLGSDENPVLSLRTVYEVIFPLRGEMAHRLFLIDDVPHQHDRDRIRQFFLARGLAEQVVFFGNMTLQAISAFNIAIFTHLHAVLEEL